MNTGALVDVISAAARNDAASILVALAAKDLDDQTFASIIRLSAYQSAEPIYYRKLLNAWKGRGSLPLKPAEREISVQILSDGTIQGLVPYLELFLGVFGIRAKIEVGPYDSVEQTALVEAETTFDATFLILSDHWLSRYVDSGLANDGSIGSSTYALASVLSNLERIRPGELFVSNFSWGSWPAPGSSVRGDGMWGHGAAVGAVNAWLSAWPGRAHVVDLAGAVHRAGGTDAIATLGYLRTHAPFTERGMVCIAREFAAGAAYAFGKGFRALLTDWDNTLWGGEVGEVGSPGVVCGQEDPDALGYYTLQRYLRDVSKLGILLASISRNAPEVIKILDENQDLALRREDFATHAFGWGNKSELAETISRDLAFGLDLMLYVDDNPVDLAEVAVRHPWIDLVIAGPAPDMTLQRLVHGSYFSLTKVSRQDQNRSAQLAQLIAQRRMMETADDPASFLQSLELKIRVEDVTDANQTRVLQLLQKTNQFNLTTRRHSTAELASLTAAGAKIGVFSYSDRFGPQGVIGLIIAVPSADAIEIDTWLMSCRVLNRGVEKAMFRWLIEQAGEKTLVGRYLPTEKNGLVKDLLPQLGFVRDLRDANAFRLSHTDALANTPDHELTHD